jgi:hypothetical protein
MKSSDIWYIDERAEQLAIVYLTRHADLTVLPARADDRAIDYLVRIRHIDPHIKRLFGVQVIGVLTRDSIETNVHGDPALKDAIHRGAAALEEPLPVCELLFVMETDEGFYRWVDEPTVTPTGQATLQHHTGAAYHPLDSAALDSIVTTVNRWYDSLS